MKGTIREALESTCVRTPAKRGHFTHDEGVLPRANDLLLYREQLLRFLKEASNMGESDMTIDELIEELEDA